MRIVTITVLLGSVLAGCAAGPAGEIDETRFIGDREYRLFVPAGVEEPVPLVLVMHGFAGTPADVRELSGFDEAARSSGFAVAYPRAAGFVPAWRTDSIISDPDVEFLVSVVDDVSGAIVVDDRRVFAGGMSNGGGMAGRLACDASNVFAAVGVVAAAHVPGACDQQRPVPIVAFHGAEDRIVPIDGRPPLLLAPGAWLQDRADAYGCTSTETSAIEPDVEEYVTTGCETDVVFYVAAEGRHGWPGSERALRNGDSTATIDATAIMWEFFAFHPIEAG